MLSQSLPRRSLLAGCAVAVTVMLASACLTDLWAAAQEIDPRQEYADCLALVKRDPKAAIERAGQWEGLGGGLASVHCRAVATDALGEHTVAATMLEDLATKGRATAALKADLLRQAAQAWSKAGQSERAQGVLDAAIALAPSVADYYEDRAVLRVGDGHLWEAIDDLNAALDLNPQRVGTLVLRAAAYRRLESADLAAADIERAKVLAPSNPDVWLEAGNLSLVAGRRDQARQDWMTVLRLSPNSASADVARGNIERLDVKVK